MNDTDFEALLSAAYAEPSARTPSPQMVAEIMERADRRRRSRRVVLAMATLAGCTIVAAAIVATGMAGLVSRALANLGPEPTLINPSVCVGIGVFLILLAAARNEIQEF
jgi:hypothetical protein